MENTTKQDLADHIEALNIANDELRDHIARLTAEVERVKNREAVYIAHLKGQVTKTYAVRKLNALAARENKTGGE